MKIEKFKKGQKILVECEFDSLAGANQAWVLIQGKPELAQLDNIKLDQPKTILKKEHAEWLEELKNEFPDDLPSQLYHITRHGWGHGLEFKSTREQKIKIIHEGGGKLKKDLVNALIYGYTVEKEKLYQIIDKRLDVTFSCLGYDIEDRVWFWGNKKFFLKNKGVRLANTKQQLIDAGFEEVFENPNYEAKEVTE